MIMSQMHVSSLSLDMSLSRVCYGPMRLFTFVLFGMKLIGQITLPPLFLGMKKKSNVFRPFDNLLGLQSCAVRYKH